MGKHVAVITMGESEEGKTSFFGCDGCVDLMENFMGWSQKEKVSLIFFRHLINVGV